MKSPVISPSTHPRRTQLLASAKRAFTLVEVTLAIGVVSFAMIAMLGLLPVGLTQFQDATSLTTRSQIFQSIASEISRTNYDLISCGTSYYDNEGNPTASATDKMTVYTATVTTNSVVAPNVNGAAGKSVIVAIQSIRTKNAGGPNAIAKYPLLIPKY